MRKSNGISVHFMQFHFAGHTHFVNYSGTISNDLIVLPCIMMFREYACSSRIGVIIFSQASVFVRDPDYWVQGSREYNRLAISLGDIK